MPTAYFETQNLNEIYEYYIKLIVAEINECLNLSGISYSDKTSPEKDTFQKNNLETAQIIFTVNNNSIPIPSDTKGIYIFFTAGNPESKRLATIISKNLGNIHYNPSDVKMISQDGEISDFPTADSSNGGDISNPNSSYYPIVAFIKDADGLSPGGSVEVSYSSKSMGTANKNAVYLQKAYIRTEDKKSYVYLRDKKTKRLKKQYITVGKTMNGQYIEIVSGVTEDDNIAFPYGKNLREGVKTKISEDDSEMIY